MKEKKVYRYGKINSVVNSIFYDFLDKKSSEGYVYSYLASNNCFRETHIISERLYHQIYNSETISYEMFEHSPQIAIELLKEEYEKNI